jgi:hypothetical protein
MAYHPQTDGATEQVNQEIKAYLLIIALCTLLNKKTLYPCWDLPITIDDMLIESTHHLN